MRQRVLPTFGVLLAAGGGGAMRTMGTFNPAMLVHAEQEIVLHRELLAAGSVRVTGTLTGIVDKGSGALVTTESVAVDAETGEPAFTTRSGAFIRGEGGFGASRRAGAASEPDGAATLPVPERPADHQVTYATLPQQALLYRLCGDRNPLHSDPSFAARAGFDRPILHGLCTYGFTGRALLHELCGSDPSRLTSVFGRFTRPVWPGQALTVSMWVEDAAGRAAFRTTADDGTVVIDRGRCTYS